MIYVDTSVLLAALIAEDRRPLRSCWADGLNLATLDLLRLRSDDLHPATCARGLRFGVIEP